jgi:hypothetical protein
VALEIVKMALEAADKTQNKVRIALCKQAQGVIHCRRGDLKRGLENLRMVYIYTYIYIYIYIHIYIYIYIYIIYIYIYT